MSTEILQITSCKHCSAITVVSFHLISIMFEGEERWRLAHFPMSSMYICKSLIFVRFAFMRMTSICRTSASEVNYHELYNHHFLTRRLYQISDRSLSTPLSCTRRNPHVSSSVHHISKISLSIQYFNVLRIMRRASHDHFDKAWYRVCEQHL